MKKDGLIYFLGITLLGYILGVFVFSVIRPVVKTENPTFKRTPPKITRISDELIPFINQFMIDAKGRVSWDRVREFDIVVEDSEDKEDGVLGTCYYGKKRISISKKFWDSHGYVPLEKKAVVYHEMGHCILNRNHTKKHSDSLGSFYSFYENSFFLFRGWKEKGSFEDGCHLSIMHPTIISLYCLERHWTEYVEELFAYSGFNGNTVENQCSEPKIRIKEGLTWNEEDDVSLSASKESCLRTYKTCLKFFAKNGEREYSAICY